MFSNPGIDLMSLLGGQAPPPNPQTEQDAANEAVNQLLQQAHEKTVGAQTAQQSALTDLTSAESTPADQISPLAAGLGMGLSRIATTLGNHDYSSEIQKTIESQNKDFGTMRTENLKRLRATYEQAAKTAQAAGDHEAEIKARVAINKLDDQQRKQAAADRVKAEQDAATTKNQRDIAMEQMKEANKKADEKAKAAKSGEDMANAFEQSVVTTNATDEKGNPITVLPIGAYTDKDTRNAALQYAAKNGHKALPNKEFEQLKDIQNARANVDNQFDSVQSYLPQGAWNRLLVAPQLKMSQALQTKDDVAAFNSWRTDAINMLRANQGGVGLRITNTEFNVAREAMPKITDTYEVAQRKLQILHTMLAARENLLLRKDWRDVQKRALRQAQSELAAIEKENKRGGKSKGATVTLWKNGISHTIPADQADDARKNYGYTDQPEQPVQQ